MYPRQQDSSYKGCKAGSPKFLKLLDALCFKPLGLQTAQAPPSLVLVVVRVLLCLFFFVLSLFCLCYLFCLSLALSLSLSLPLSCLSMSRFMCVCLSLSLSFSLSLSLALSLSLSLFTQMCMQYTCIYLHAPADACFGSENTKLRICTLAMVPAGTTMQS